MDDEKRRELGMQVRKNLWGDAFAKSPPMHAKPFSQDFQDLAIRYAYGEAWARPGLDLKLRRCTTMGMLVALNRMEEFKIHARGALRADVSREELKEILLQAAVYCGMPAANGAFRAAQEVLDELDATTAR